MHIIWAKSFEKTDKFSFELLIKYEIHGQENLANLTKLENSVHPKAFKGSVFGFCQSSKFRIDKTVSVR
jgi:hypothetical protein